MPLDLHKNISFHKFTKDDFANYLCLYQNEAAMKYVTGKALSVEEAMKDYSEILNINEVDHRLGFFKVNFSGQFVGLTKLRLLSPSSNIAELGYILLPQFWSKGFGSFVVEQMLLMARSESKIRKIRAIIDPKNTASRKILIKNGFESKNFCEIDAWPSEILLLEI